MRSRCNNPNRPFYKRYGGRGIKVCFEWSDYSIFREWAINNGYSDNLQIDRIKNDKGYSPDNCQWITRLENTIKGNASKRKLKREDINEIKKMYKSGENDNTGSNLDKYNEHRNISGLEQNPLFI